MTYKKGFPIPGDCLTYCFICRIHTISRNYKTTHYISKYSPKPEGFEKW